MDAQTLKEQGNTAFEEGRWEEAIDFYTQAINVKPDDAAFYSNRAAAYNKMAQHRKASEDAQRCISLNEGWFKGYFRLAEAYTGMKLLAKALDAFEKAAELNPQSSELRQAVEMAHGQLNKKKVEKEMKELKVHPGALPQRQEPEEGSRKDIDRIRNPAAPKIGSMDEYMKYRAAGGAKLAPTGSSPYLAEIPQEFSSQPRSRADFMREMGLNDDDAAEAPRMGESGGGGGGGGNKAELAAKRAEFLKSLGMDAGGGGGGGGGNPNGSVLTGDWARLAASEGVGPSTTTTTTSHYKAPSSPPEREERRDITTPDSGRRIRNSDLPSVAANASNRSDFIAAMGLDMRGADSIDYGYTKARQENAEVREAFPPDGMGSAPVSYSSSRIRKEEGFDSSPMSTSSGPHTGATSSTYEATLHSVGSTPAPTPPPHAAADKYPHTADNAAGRSGANTPYDHLLRDAPTPQLVDYSALGASVGAGDAYKAELMSSWRSKKTVLPATPQDERLQQLKSNYQDFSYRKYKESGPGEGVVHLSTVGEAILAEAMSGYDENGPGPGPGPVKPSSHWV